MLRSLAFVLIQQRLVHPLSKTVGLCWTRELIWIFWSQRTQKQCSQSSSRCSAIWNSKSCKETCTSFQTHQLALDFVQQSHLQLRSSQQPWIFSYVRESSDCLVGNEMPSSWKSSRSGRAPSTPMTMLRLVKCYRGSDSTNLLASSSKNTSKIRWAHIAA